MIGSYDEYKKDYNLTLARIYTENLLRNSDVSEGEELIVSTPVTPELIENGSTNNGNEVVMPNLSWDNMEVPHRHIQSQTRIKYHPEITQGSIQAYDPGQAAVPQTDSVFELINQDLLNQNYMGISGANAFNYQNASASPPNLTIPFDLPNTTSISSSIFYPKDGVYQYSTSDYVGAFDNNNYRFKRKLDGEDNFTWTYFNNTSTLDFSSVRPYTYLESPVSGQYDQTFQSTLSAGTYLFYQPITGLGAQGQMDMGIMCEGWKKNPNRQ